MDDVLERIRSFQQEPPVNIEGLIESFGIELRRKAKLDPEIAGELEQYEPGKFRISVNGADNYFRRRFTMAHELGHYILHRHLIGTGIDDDRAYRSTSVGNYYNRQIEVRHEQDANKFAASVLMPRLLVQSLWTEKHQSPDEVAKALQVSRAAMSIRLASLGLP